MMEGGVLVIWLTAATISWQQHCKQGRVDSGSRCHGVQSTVEGNRGQQEPSQEAKRGGCWYSACCLLSIQPEKPVHEMMSPHAERGSPIPLNFSGNYRRCIQRCVCMVSGFKWSRATVALLQETPSWNSDRGDGRKTRLSCQSRRGSEVWHW